jgi:hypothetical protein
MIVTNMKNHNETSDFLTVNIFLPNIQTVTVKKGTETELTGPVTEKSIRAETHSAQKKRLSYKRLA